MKLPGQFPQKPVILITVLIAVLLISVLGIRYFFLSSQTKILDDFPIMVINHGQNTVYQEVTVSKSATEKNIVVGSLGERKQEAVKIYEEIPKEVAQKVSDLQFNIQPQIIEDDPLIMWDLGPIDQEPKKINYVAKKRMEETQCLDKKYFNDMRDVYKLDPFDFNDCYKYLHIKFLNAMYQNQKRREQEEKDSVKLIQHGEKQYQEIQKKAKEIIEKRAQITPASGLKGNWSGLATFQNTENPQNYCTFTGNLELKIGSQSNNEISGQFSYTTQKAVPHGGGTKCKTGITDKYQIRAAINGSRLENMRVNDIYGMFDGSFTGDTLTLNQSQTTSLKLIGPANLLR